MARAKKRADGRYCAQIYLGRDENGRRQYKSVYAKSPAELKEKETAVRLRRRFGIDTLVLPPAVFVPAQVDLSAIAPVRPLLGSCHVCLLL